ncbi:MAG: sigma-54-dependent Fis family transcriptional regulator [Candidatus Omnitrophica bacterium]|nr:sigma-54-dependent Fis family transcriptional regulator [Candidatus Omnitrophota bacterium]
MDILIVDDEEKMRVLLQANLKAEGHRCMVAGGGEEAITLMGENAFDAVVTDLKMEPVDGMEVLKEARAKNPPVEVVVMTAYASVETALEATHEGAYDFLCKPFKNPELLHILERIDEKRRMRWEIEHLRDHLTGEEVLGESPAMQSVFSLVKQVAERDTTVLLRGESGTGKERVARLLHSLSPRKDRPMVAVHCGALTETLLESELFGHEKGSFTGAHERRAGRFERAQGGTLFLDEIGDISLSVQVKLLRVLQEKKFERVGGSDTLTADVRIVAATHRHLEEMIKEGTFREDLFYRLSVFPIELPPLRNRKEDIPILAQSFLAKFGKGRVTLGKRAEKALASYAWPGNVRELENLMERATILCPEGEVGLEHLPPGLSHGLSSQVVSGDFQLPEEGLVMDELEKSLILQALERSKGNKSSAAGLLGLTRRQLYTRLEKYGLGSEED